MEYSKEIFASLAIFIGMLSSIPYILGLIKRTNKPHMFSWIIWAIISGTGSAVQFAEGGGAGSYFMLYNSLSCLGIAIASYWLGTKDITRSDWIALIAALSAIPLWMITNEAMVALALIIAIDGVAYYPTIRKSWKNPHDEVAITWLMSGVVFGLSIMALETYALTTYLYPLVFIFINTGLGIMLLMRRRELSPI